MVLVVPRLGPAEHDGIVGVQGGGSHHTPRAQVASLLSCSQREHVVTILRGSVGKMRKISRSEECHFGGSLEKLPALSCAKRMV